MRIYFIDSCALINNTDLLNSLYGTIIIHNVVLDELDNKTNKSGVAGKNARCVIDKLFQVSKRGNIHKGVNIGNGTIIKIDDTKPDLEFLSFGLDTKKSDNLLLAVYNEIIAKHKDDEVYFYTGDKGLSIKIENGIVQYVAKGGESNTSRRKQPFRKDTKAKINQKIGK